MICIFEDNSKSLTARLLLTLYPNNCNYIKFSEGNGNVYKEAKEHLSKGGNGMCIFRYGSR